MTFNHLLLATNGSKSSQKAEDYAFYLCQHYAIKLTILFVLDDRLCHYGKFDTLAPLESRESFVSYVIDEQKDEAKKLIKILSEKAAKYHNPFYEMKVKQGQPLSVIAAVAKEENVDVILIGGKRSKRKSGFKSITLADKLTSQTDQSILKII